MNCELRMLNYEFVEAKNAPRFHYSKFVILHSIFFSTFKIRNSIIMAKKPPTLKSVESLTHDEATRNNIPTGEFKSVLEKEQQKPTQIRYPRNTDLDPQLVWRGKDEQDWSARV